MSQSNYLHLYGFLICLIFIISWSLSHFLILVLNYKMIFISLICLYHGFPLFTLLFIIFSLIFSIISCPIFFIAFFTLFYPLFLIFSIYHSFLKLLIRFVILTLYELLRSESLILIFRAISLLKSLYFGWTEIFLQ